MKISVNGILIDVDSASLTYERLVILAGIKGNPSATYSTKRDAEGAHRSGSMWAGTTVTLSPGMAFSVMHTNKA